MVPSMIFETDKIQRWQWLGIIRHYPRSRLHIVCILPQVESIVAHRKSGRTDEYLVRWKGFSADVDSWEPKRNLSGECKALLDAFHIGENVVQKVIPDSLTAL